MWIWIDRAIDALALTAGVLLCGLVALICADVGARYFQLFAMPWSFDAAVHTLYLVTFLGAPWVLRERGHIAVDVVVQLLHGRARRVIDRVVHALGAVVCAALLYFSCVAFWRSYVAGTEIHRTFVFPEWWLLTAAPPVFLILFAIFLRWLLAGPPQRPAAPETPTDGL